MATRRQPPVHIPMPFEQAVAGLLAVDPRKPEDDIRQRAADLRRKIEHKAANVEKHRAKAASIEGDDKAAVASRRYYDGLARHHDGQRQQLQDELNDLIGRG
ncbi:MAG: hypothetical protein KY476_03485 [Planctomycetes bacterium]|nr:hypothetical protein [Planctomycetota bacterium]